jgi:hypothetical protein
LRKPNSSVSTAEPRKKKGHRLSSDALFSYRELPELFARAYLSARRFIHHRVVVYMLVADFAVLGFRALHCLGTAISLVDALLVTHVRLIVMHLKSPQSELSRRSREVKRFLSDSLQNCA